ncbi:MAG: hypothetical protein K0R68_1261 [Mycobacterium sp.]|nr:hypothetical protein [Mycobacterium sp.]
MGNQLRAELGNVTAGPAADDAAVALGEGPVRRRLEAALRALAVHRGPQSSTCPSDAARAVGAQDWRDLMDDARDIARALAVAGEVEITQRGKVLDPATEWRGPIRVRVSRPT